MSKIFSSFLFASALILQILQFFTQGTAQDIDATIKIGDDVRVEGRFFSGQPNAKAKSLSFMLEYAGISGLGERIAGLRLFDNEGKAVTFRQMVAGEYLAERDISSFAYTINLSITEKRLPTAHLSFIDRDGGMLFAEDLLPLIQHGKTCASFDLPTSWKVFTNIRPNAKNEYEISDSSRGVFAVGPSWRKHRVLENDASIDLLIKGDWLFQDSEAAAMITEIVREYSKTFGTGLTRDVQIALLKISDVAARGSWDADTRGANVTIISGDMPFTSQAFQRLHEQLRHEIFHLWIPNGVNLSGRYDWFYEGFALYQSLKLGVGVNRLRFADFLATLSQAYDLEVKDQQRISLIDASLRRWNGSNSTIYARGMLVAFLCDIAILNSSGGKRSSSNILAGVYSRHRSGTIKTDGNAAILGLLRSRKELVPIAERYISGSQKIDIDSYLAMAGMRLDQTDGTPRFSVSDKPSRRQRVILDRLGYNNWRKLSQGNR